MKYFYVIVAVVVIVVGFHSLRHQTIKKSGNFEEIQSDESVQQNLLYGVSPEM